MSRTYSDPSFGSRKLLKGAIAGVAINGTNATATQKEVLIEGAPRALSFVGFTAKNGVIGTQAIANKLYISTLLAGTGAAVPIGTLSVGTAGEVIAANATLTGTISGTCAAGDTVAWYTAIGTETAANLRLIPVLEYVEIFDNDLD